MERVFFRPHLTSPKGRGIGDTFIQTKWPLSLWERTGEGTYFPILNSPKGKGRMPPSKSRNPSLRGWDSVFVWNKLNLNLCLGIGDYRYDTLVAGAFVEIHHAVNKCIQCIVLANTYVLTRIVLCATLANDDVAGNNLLTTPNLNTESLCC